ncbi:DUF4142 domain-containing protein [Methylorubrum sp. SB2]|uniref:DUF4142 domain-containing protein n=1 Tax=Methylorubrum subtropicum TaxID=3138812 RepID=UPI00313EFA04
MLKNYAVASALVAVMATPAFAQSTGDFRTDALQANSFEIQSSQIALQKSRNPAVRAFAKEAIRDHHAAAVALTGGGRDAVAGGMGGPIGGLIEAPLQIAGGAVGAATGAAAGVVGGTLQGGPVGGLQGAGTGAARGAAAGTRAFDVDTTAGTGLGGRLNPQQQQMLAELSAAPAGPQFDRLYGRQQVMSHQMSLQMHQSYAQSGPNPALRNYAQQAVPVLQEHYTMAQRLPGAR